MFTIFHLLQLIALVIGLIAGAYYGGNYFGWLGGILGALLGAFAGFAILGRIPFLLSFAILRCDLKQTDTATLKENLKTQFFISHLIIAELVRRGELVEEFRDYIFSLLQSEYFDQRRFGWQNLNIWFPELAAQVETFDPMSPANESKTKLASLQGTASCGNVAEQLGEQPDGNY